MTQSRIIQDVRDVALVTRNPQVGRMVAEALQHGSTRLRLAEHDLDAPLPELAILDVDLGDAAERGRLERALTAFGDRVAFVVTSGNPTVEGMRALMRHGIVDLLPQPLAAEEVRRAAGLALEAFRRRRPNAAPAAPRGKVTSVLRAGGGAGGTTIATQAACALAKGRSVCVLDFDVQFGSAAFHLGLPQRTSLLDLLNAGERLDGAMLKSSVSRHASGVEVLAAPPAIQPMDALSPDLAQSLLREARGQYALTVVDLPLSWSAGSRAALAESDRILLVLQPIMPSLRHAKRQLETLQEEGLDHIPLSVVANRMRQGLFTDGPSARDIETALGRRVDHVLPEDEAFAQAVNQGTTLSHLGATRVAKRLSAILEALVATP